MIIEVCGPGCPRCQATEKNAVQALKELGMKLGEDVTCPPKLGPLEMRDSCRITTGGSSCENKKVFGGAGISDSPGG